MTPLGGPIAPPPEVPVPQSTAVTLAAGADITFLRPVKLGQRLVAHASVRKTKLQSALPT